MIAVARRYRFQAQHHLPDIKGYDEPHWHDYTVEIRALSGIDEKFLDTAQLDEWWAGQPQHEQADLNEIYASTTVEEISSVLLHNAMKVIGPEVVSVTVWEDDDRWGRAA